MADSDDIQREKDSTDDDETTLVIEDDFGGRVRLIGSSEVVSRVGADTVIGIMNRRLGTSKTWLYVPGIVFAAAFAALIFLMTFADRTTLPDALYYVILIPLGGAAAAFLFGALRSSAKWSGTALGGTLVIGGPAVVFFLVVAIGLYANRETTFGLTVRVHGPPPSNDVIGKGRLTIYLGTVQRSDDIRSNGEAVFNGVPSSYVGQRIRITADVDSFEMGSRDSVTIPASHVVELGLVRRQYETRVRGSVQSQNGNPVRDAAIDINNGLVTARSDSAGNFSLVLPMAPGTVVRMVVRRTGFQPYEQPWTVSAAEPPRIVLTRSR